MTDLSKLSDDELKALYGQTAAPSSDLSKLSDQELLALQTVKEPTKPQPDMSAGEIATDVAKSGGIGLAKGGIGITGAAGDARNLLSAATDYLTKKAGGSPETAQSIKDFARKGFSLNPIGYVMANAPSSGDIQKGIEGVTGEFYKPKTTAGEYAQTVGEFAPGAVGGGGSALSRVLARVALPAVASETAGQLTKGTDAEPYARIAAAVAAPGAISAARRVITPFPANATRTDLANVLAHEGVDLTAGQRTGNRPLQWAESALGDMPFAGGRPAETMTRQQEQFTAAALRRAGETAERASPEVVNRAFDRIGNQFETIGARNQVVPDRQFVSDLVAARDDYNNLVGPHTRAPVVDNTIRDLSHLMGQNGGPLTGEQYNAVTSRLAKLARNAKTDPQLQEALQSMRNALDDAFERTLQASGNTADLDALRQARREYRNLLVIEKAATGAGSNAAEGLISPSQLKGAVVQQNRRGYARGQGDYADLARAGDALLKPLPQTGTAPRQNIQNLITTLSAIIGGAAGSPAGPLGAGLGAAAAVAAPATAGRVIMSRPVQAYLGNQLLANAPQVNAGSPLARALLASRAAGVPQEMQRNLAQPQQQP